MAAIDPDRLPNIPNGRRQFLMDAAYVLNDPKIKALSDREFRCLVKLWCHACLFGGIPSGEGEQAAIVGLRVDYWRASSDLALSWFRPSSDLIRPSADLAKTQVALRSELLVSPMMLADAEAYASSIEKRKTSGRLGGLASAVSRRSKAEASASPETKQNEATVPHLTSLHRTSPVESSADDDDDPLPDADDRSSSSFSLRLAQEFWNQHRGPMRESTIPLTPHLQQLFAAIVKQGFSETACQQAILKMAALPHFRGETTGNLGDFVWLLGTHKDSGELNFCKVLNGDYDPRVAPKKQPVKVKPPSYKDFAH